MIKNERLEKEVYGLLNTNRDLERENNSVKERLANCENMLVIILLRRSVNIRTEGDLLLLSLMVMACWLYRYFVI